MIAGKGVNGATFHPLVGIIGHQVVGRFKTIHARIVPIVSRIVQGEFMFTAIPFGVGRTPGIVRFG